MYIFDSTHYIPTKHAHQLLVADDKSLQLDDGSIWKPSGYDLKKASYWDLGDQIIASQNSRWFSSHSYCLHNLTRGQTIEADLLSSAAKQTIASIDFSSRTITLSDQTSWIVAESDNPILSSWRANEPVYLGYNCSQDEAYSTLLMNPEAKTCIRIRQHN